jgi:hypothetical protein
VNDAAPYIEKKLWRYREQGQLHDFRPLDGRRPHADCLECSSEDIGCGQADNICIEGSKNLDALLTKGGSVTSSRSAPGGHTWANWRFI